MKTKLILVVIIFFGLFGLTKSSMAEDYYVSPAGVAAWTDCDALAKNDEAACSWQTAMANAVAGDTVYFRGGNYNNLTERVEDYETPIMAPANSGTDGSPIIFQAYPNETPIIQQPIRTTGNNGRIIFGAHNRNWITWDGFTGVVYSPDIVGVNHLTAVTGNSHDVTIKNCDLIGTAAESTDYQNRSFFTTGSTPGVHNVYFYNNKLHGWTGVSANVNTASIWLFGTSDSVYIYNNEIYGSKDGLAYKAGNGTNIHFYNNYIHDLTGTGVLHNWNGAGSDGVYINNNLFVNTNGALNGYDAPADNYHLWFYNNTVYASSGITGITLNTSAQHTYNAQIFNNIFYLGGSSLGLRLHSGPTRPDYVDNNLYFGTIQYQYDGSSMSLASWRTTTNYDLSSLTSNPQFVSPGGSNPEDYKLQSGSPARTGRGGNYASVMGAYITGNETIGYTTPGQSDTTPPAAPHGLTVQ